jgi:hypothetical protein
MMGWPPRVIMAGLVEVRAETPGCFPDWKSVGRVG